MTRTIAREIAVQLVYSLSINKLDASEMLDSFFAKDYYSTLKQEDPLYTDRPDNLQRGYIEKLVTGVAENQDMLRSYIEKYAKNWKIGRISKTAVSAMAVSIYEILYMEDIPNAAAINEAVEVSKGYEEQETVAFINGILGSFIRGELKGAEIEEPAELMYEIAKPGYEDDEPVQDNYEPVQEDDEPQGDTDSY